MVRALAILLLCQLIGTVLQEGAGLPIPGPVFGLILLLGWFVWRGGPGAALRGTADGLLRYLGLLFVPAGVGVVTEFNILRDNALALLIAIPVSTVLGLVVTGVTMNYFLSGAPMLEHLPPFFHVWAYLQTQPLLGLTATLCVWEIAVWLDKRAGHNALTNPTVLAIVILAALLVMTYTSYAAYFTGAVYIHFLLGPATVALAVPMFDHWQAIRRNFVPIIVSLTAGSIVSAGSAMLIAMAFHAPRVLIISLGPKSVTTAIAMGVSQALGGQPALTAVFVLLTGMFGTVVCTGVLRVVRVDDWRAQGLAAGTAAHGLATARMLGLNQAAGAFGGLAIGLNGMVTSMALPVMVALLGL